METCIQEYITMLKVERNLSSKTINAYKSDLDSYLSYINNLNINSLAGITTFDIRNYIRILNRTGKASNSISRIISSIRSYHKFLSSEKIVKDNPALVIDSPKIPKKLPEVLSEKEISSITDSIDKSSKFYQRDRAIIEMLYSCGVRVSELCDLDISNLFLDD